MRKWVCGDQNITCTCGEDQTISYLLVCPAGPSPCMQDDLMTSNQKEVDEVQFWAK